MKNKTSNVNKQLQTMRLLAEQVSRAVWLGEMPLVIDSLAQLANCALASGHVYEKKLIDFYDAEAGESGIKMLFRTIDRCAAEHTDSYSELYYLCTQLTSNVLKANGELVFKPVSLN